MVINGYYMEVKIKDLGYRDDSLTGMIFKHSVD